MIKIKEIEKNRLVLQSFLKTFLIKTRKEFKNVSYWSKDIEEKILDFSSSGKMLRGVLVMLSSGKSDQDTLKIATAIELLHSAFLIHDDIMDQDVLRRGKDAIHVRYTKELSFLKGDINHYGISQAISLGDICIFLSFVLINDLTSSNKEKIRSFFINEMIRVGFGQMEDMMVSFSAKDTSIEEIFSIYKSKTARYSISVPVVLGMYLNNEKENIIKKSFLVGEALGIAFQMKDDELGIFGQPQKTGKGVFKDVNKDKKTILRLLLLNSLNKKERSKVEPLFGREALSSSEIIILTEVFEKYKIKNKHTDMMNDYVKKSEKIYGSLPAKYKNIFEFIKEYNQNRVK